LEQRLLRLEFRGLDAFGNLHFLLAGEQGDLAHLLEVHPDRVVQNVVLRGTRLLLLRLLHPLLVVLDLVGLEDLDLEVLQDREDVIDLLLVLDRLGQRLVDVVERQVALLLGKPDQVPDLVVDATGGSGFRAALRAFFAEAPAMNPLRAKIEGMVCGVRVETVEEPLMREIRRLDKLIDELARGKPLDRILRT